MADRFKADSCWANRLSEFKLGYDYSDPQEVSEQIKKACPNLNSSCCSDEKLTALARRVGVHKKNFEQIKRFFIEFGQLYDTNNSRNPLRGYDETNISPECFPPNGAIFFQKLDLSFIDKLQRLSEQITADFACTLCNGDFLSWVRLRKEAVNTYITIVQNNKNIGRYFEVLKALEPIIAYLENKKNHVEAIKCMKKEQYSFSAIMETIKEVEDKLDPNNNSDTESYEYGNLREALISIVFVPAGLDLDYVNKFLVTGMIEGLIALEPRVFEDLPNVELEELFSLPDHIDLDFKSMKVDFDNIKGFDLSENHMDPAFWKSLSSEIII